MSDPAYFFIGDDIYYGRHEAREVDQWLLWGPEVLEPYLRTLGPPVSFKGYDAAFGGFALFLDEKRLLWFGGAATRLYPLECRLYLKLQRALWPSEWTLEWAGRGLDSLLRATGRKPASNAWRLDERCPWVNQQFELLGSQSHLEFGTRGSASVRNLDSTLSLYPLPCGDVTESFLWAGPERTLAALSQRSPSPTLTFPTDIGETGGFHIDLRTKTLGYWSHNPHVYAHLAKAWPDWSLTDWEHRFEAHIQAADGKLEVVYPDLAKMLTVMESTYAAHDPNPHSVFQRYHPVYDQDYELTASLEFPINHQRRRELWTRALVTTGLDAPPYPVRW